MFDMDRAFIRHAQLRLAKLHDAVLGWRPGAI